MPPHGSDILHGRLYSHRPCSSLVPLSIVRAICVTRRSCPVGVTTSKCGCHSGKKLHFGLLTERAPFHAIDASADETSDICFGLCRFQGLTLVERRRTRQMPARKRRMTMEQTISILRKAGWKIDVDESNKRIVLREPCPDANWLHLLRPKHSREDGQDDGH
jgi:hypothetical protein